MCDDKCDEFMLKLRSDIATAQKLITPFTKTGANRCKT